MATTGLIQKYKAKKAARKLVKKTGGKTGFRLRQRLRSGSALLSLADRLSSRISWSLTHGAASAVLCGADLVEKAWQNSLLMRFIRWLGRSDSHAPTIRGAIARGAGRSLLFAWVTNLRRAFFHTRVRGFGIALLFGALYNIGGFFLHRNFGMAYGADKLSDLIVTAFLLLASIPMLFSKITLCRLLSENRLLSWLFLRVLSIDPASLREDSEIRVSAHGGLAFAVGTTLGITSVFFTPGRVLAALGIFLFASVLLCVPEAGLLSCAFLLPVASLSVTEAVVIGTTVSFLWKFLRLKRHFRFGAGEAFLSVCVLTIWLAAQTGGDTGTAKTALLYGLLWILATNLLGTEALFRKFLSCLLYGGILTLLFPAVSGLMIRFAPARWQITLPSYGLAPEVIRSYLLMLLPLVLFSAKRLAGFVCLALSAVTVYLLGDSWLYLGVLLTALLYTAIANRAGAGAALTGAVTVPMLAVLLGKRLGSLGTHFSAAAETLARRYWPIGVGAGKQALAAAANAGGILWDGASCGLYERLILEGGVPELIAFLCMTLFALQCLFFCLRKEPSPGIRKICGGLAASGIAFLLSAAYTDVWCDLRVLGVFFFVCAAMTVPGRLYEGAGPEGDAGTSN